MKQLYIFLVCTFMYDVCNADVRPIVYEGQKAGK